MAYGGGKESGKSYVSMMTAFVDAFPGKNIYAVIAPIATEFYLPEKARNVSNPQSAPIYYVRDNLPVARDQFADAVGHAV